MISNFNPWNNECFSNTHKFTENAQQPLIRIALNLVAVADISYGLFAFAFVFAVLLEKSSQVTISYNNQSKFIVLVSVCMYVCMYLTCYHESAIYFRRSAHSLSLYLSLSRSSLSFSPALLVDLAFSF